MANPISMLQELTVKMGIGIPIYTYEDITEPSSPNQFKCHGSCNGIVVMSIGSSKKAAKTSTATQLLNLINMKPDLLVSNPSPTNDTKTASSYNLLPKTTVDNCVVFPEPMKNAVSLLQEYTIVNGMGYPKYEYKDITQPSSNSQFECYGSCGSNITSRAIATSKSGAKLKVAENMYRQLCPEHSSCSSISTKSESSYSEGVSSLKKSTDSIDLNNISNVIGYLQEYTLKNDLPMPQYNIVEVKESYCLGFKCTATCGSITVSKVSTSKKSAKLQAAQVVLSELLNVPLPTGASNLCSDNIELYDNGNLDNSDNGSEFGSVMFKSGITIEKDAVSKINEYCLQNKSENARYNPMGSTLGMFRIQCVLDNLLTEGYGNTKKMAKKNAAEKMLKCIDDTEPCKMKIYKEKFTDDEIISKFSELTIDMGTDLPQNRDYQKIDESYSEIIEEYLDIKKEIVEKVITPPPTTAFVDYEAEIKRMLKQLKDSGIQYEIVQTSKNPYVMYFNYIKSGNSELSSMKTGDNPLVVKYKLLDYELRNIKN